MPAAGGRAPLGMIGALGRLARGRPVRWLATACVELLRATPLLLLILFSSLVLPEYGIDLPLFWYAVLGLSLYNGAVMAEIFRAGILSLEKGQAEAAYAVGLRYWQAMRLVVIPQAVRLMVPALISANVTLLKDPSLAYVVAYEELLRRGRIVGEFSNNPLQALMVVAVMFIIVNFTLGAIARRLEVRQRRRYGGGPDRGHRRAGGPGRRPGERRARPGYGPVRAILRRERRRARVGEREEGRCRST
jgi:glutamate transport system permease protein